MATLMDLIMREYGGAKPQPSQAPVFPQVYGPLTRQLATEVPLGNGSMPGGALARELATNVPLPNGSLPSGALTRQLATEVPVPTGPVIPQAPAAVRPSPWDETGIGAPYNPMAMVANAQRFPSMADRIKADPLAVAGANTPIVAGLDTTNRPAPMASSVTAPAREQGFFEKLFKGPQYQSNNLPVNAVPQGAMNFTGETMPSYINWGDPNNAADFFRADALLRQQNPSFFGLLGGNNG
jgi:hypothetical protein